MSGYVPKRVSNGRMRTKTNQSGLKLAGNPASLGRRGYLIDYIGNRVNTRLLVCGPRKYNGITTHINYPYGKGGSTEPCRAPQPKSCNNSSHVGWRTNPRIRYRSRNQGGTLIKCPCWSCHSGNYGCTRWY
jgi:hypothetical protein